ncbi:MAG: hypothetical protein ACOCUS_03040 [Polyangiales bacterium]
MSDVIPSAVLMCHAPIVIPDIGGAEAPRCASSTHAMREASRHVVGARPDVVVIASPHAPRHPASWLVAEDPRVGGSFGRFGVPHVGAAVPFAAHAARAIVHAATEAGLSCAGARLGELDHGTLVPLWFLTEAGWDGPTVRIALPMQPTHEGCAAMGRAIEAAARAEGQRWVVVASGDMSHRLTHDAPAGYDPQAHRFDEAVCDRVHRGKYDAIARLDPDLRERAGEDVVDTLEIAAGAVGGDATGHRLLSYEGPFGVGYLVAVLHDSQG